MGGFARILVKLAAVVTLSADEAAGESTTLPAKRDTNISFDQAEVTDNYGQSPHLRARQLGGNSAEVVLLDFDRAAITSFVKAHRGKKISVKLRFWALGAGGEPAKLEAMALDSAVDWSEGQESGTNAAKGESCATAAQFQTAPWQRLDGKPAADLREVISEKGFDRVTMPTNGPTLAVANGDAGKQVELELDEKFVAHLALEPKCRGVVLFTRDKGWIDFSSREQHGKVPELVITVAK